MNRKSIKYKFLSIICLFWVNIVFGNSVKIYSSWNIQAIQFAVTDLKQALETKGNPCELLPKSFINREVLLPGLD